MAPILCAGVTTYKGLKETEARPGEWVAISGIGGLGHVAIQYAKAMGLKSWRSTSRRTSSRWHARPERMSPSTPVRPDAVADVLKATGGGAHGMLVTAVSPPAFCPGAAYGAPQGYGRLVGLPPGEFPTPIFDVVLKRITLRGSIVGTRRDLDEAIAFAAEGKVKAEITRAPLSDINKILANLKAGKVSGRIVLDLAAPIVTSSKRTEAAPA